MIVRPTLVIHGCETNRTTRRICELISAVITQAHRKEVPGGGHMCPLTHAHIVNEAVAQYLEALDSAAPLMAA